MADQIREAIRCARIAPGTRLPSSRRLSEQLEISRNTVVRAYDELLMEGIVEARPASGIYVVEQPAAKTNPVHARVEATDQALHTRMPMPLRKARAETAPSSGRSRLLFDFFPGRPSAELFPLKTWRRLLQGNLTHGGAAGFTQYGDPAGLPALRTAIANHLAASRGIVADPSRIVVVSGTQEGLNIAARLFLARGSLSVVEDPCYRGAVAAFEATGAEVASVAVDRDGLVTSELPRLTASLLYLTPSHQYPTGATLSQQRRIEAIGWARRYGCYIVEDDMIAISATRDRTCNRSRRWRRTARSISAPSRNPSAVDCGWASWWCRSRSPTPSAPRKRCSTTATPGSNRQRWPI